MVFRPSFRIRIFSYSQHQKAFCRMVLSKEGASKASSPDLAKAPHPMLSSRLFSAKRTYLSCSQLWNVLSPTFRTLAGTRTSSSPEYSSTCPRAPPAPRSGPRRGGLRNHRTRPLRSAAESGAPRKPLVRSPRRRTYLSRPSLRRTSRRLLFPRKARSRTILTVLDRVSILASSGPLTTYLICRSRAPRRGPRTSVASRPPCGTRRRSEAPGARS